MDPHHRGGAQHTRNYAWRDYGNRVGIWRIFDLFDELAVIVIDERQKQLEIPLDEPILRDGRNDGSFRHLLCDGIV